MIDITQLTSQITAFRNETQSEAITPESLGELLQQIAEQIANAETLQDVQPLISSIRTAQADIASLKTQKQSSGGRGFIYVDINDSQFLKICGADDYLNDNYVPYLFRYTTKANRYLVGEVEGISSNYHEHKRKGWHPFGDDSTTTINEHKVVYIDTNVFDINTGYKSCLPQDFVKVKELGGGYKWAAYGCRMIPMCDEDNGNPRRVKLLYGIAFMPKSAIEANKRLDLSKLATNIATFHLQYEEDASKKSWHWNFNK